MTQENKTIKYKLEAAVGSDVGLVRTFNGDRTFAYIRHPSLGQALGLFIVADGMGGGETGGIAAELAINRIYQSLSWILKQTDDKWSEQSEYPEQRTQIDFVQNLFQEEMIKAFQAANQAILRYEQNNQDIIKGLAEVTCALVFGNLGLVGHIGTCRAYHWRKGIIKQLTDDHNFTSRAVREGLITAEEATFFHPNRNVVIPIGLGVRQKIEVDIVIQLLQEGDRLLLCSDGLSEAVDSIWHKVHDKDELSRLMKDLPTVEAAAKRLIEAANAKGGYDNIGVVVVELKKAIG